MTLLKGAVMWGGPNVAMELVIISLAVGAVFIEFFWRRPQELSNEDDKLASCNAGIKDAFTISITPPEADTPRSVVGEKVGSDGPRNRSGSSIPSTKPPAHLPAIGEVAATTAVPDVMCSTRTPSKSAADFSSAGALRRQSFVSPRASLRHVLEPHSANTLNQSRDLNQSRGHDSVVLCFSPAHSSLCESRRNDQDVAACDDTTTTNDAMTECEGRTANKEHNVANTKGGKAEQQEQTAGALRRCFQHMQRDPKIAVLGGVVALFEMSKKNHKPPINFR
jgi:hypothetical protein